MANDSKKVSQAEDGRPTVGRAVVRAVSGPLNLGVAGTAAIAAAAINSWPVAAVGGVAYLALVAWDLVTPKTWRAREQGPAPVELPEPSKLADPQARDAITGIAATRAELERVLDDTPAAIRARLMSVRKQIAELEHHAARLVARGEELYDYLAKTNPEPVRREIARLEEKVRGARDNEARAQYDSARAARVDQLKALDDIANARDRLAANVARIAATLAGMPAKVVRMRALDAQAMDSLTGDLNHELESVNGDMQSFEETLKELMEIGR